ncbi:MAG: hypothetical protein EOO38_08430 [Cytophagaceae bacterium]|nr:MAG: hypothetical protein EOO38_08430 [Cytophagaceae bacterium]
MIATRKPKTSKAEKQKQKKGYDRKANASETSSESKEQAQRKKCNIHFNRKIHACYSPEKP